MNRIKNGFTLVEILAVVIVLSLIMIVAIPAFIDMISDSQHANRTLIYDYIMDASETFIKRVADGEDNDADINGLKGYGFIKDKSKYYTISVNDLVKNGYYNEDCDVTKAQDSSLCKITGDNKCVIKIVKTVDESNGYYVLDDIKLSLHYFDAGVNLESSDNSINGMLDKDSEDLEKCIK